MADAIQAFSGWERVAIAVEQVRDRLRAPSRARGGQGALCRHWRECRGRVGWARRSGRGAQHADVDILLRRADFDAAKAALEAAGFVYRHAASIDMFLDGPGAKARDAIHVVFAKEKVRENAASPDRK